QNYGIYAIWFGNAFLWLTPRLAMEMEVNQAYPDSAPPIPNFYAAAKNYFIISLMVTLLLLYHMRSEPVSLHYMVCF
ncbi:hypothetical protein M422DRAFT_37509, partial [Sphaerobolus stellatus SS14]